MVRDSSFMSKKVILWVILDLNSLNRLGLLPTWLILLQIKLRITILHIIYPKGICTSEGYKGTFIAHCHDDNDGYGELKSVLQPETSKNHVALIYHNLISTYVSNI